MENNRRNGKIARLPKDERNIINQMLEDGATYDAVLQKLNELGHSEFNLVNIHNWKIGGFREWQADRIDSIRQNNLRFFEMKGTSDGAGLACMQLAAWQLYTVLAEFDPDSLRRRLAQKPECYFDIMLAFTRLVKNKVRFENIIEGRAREEAWRKESQELMLKKAQEEQQAKKQIADEPQEEDAQASDSEPVT